MGLVRLHRNPRNLRQHLAGGKDSARSLPRFRKHNGPGRTRIAMTTLFERSIARSLADAVNRALHLPRAILHPGPASSATANPRSLWQCVEIVTLSIPATFSRSVRIKLPIFLGHGVADGVGNVDRGCARRDQPLPPLGRETAHRFGSRLRREFHVRAKRFRMPDGVARSLQALFARDA